MMSERRPKHADPAGTEPDIAPPGRVADRAAAGDEQRGGAACHSACGLALAWDLIVGDIASPSSRPNANSRPALADADCRVKFMQIRQARAAMNPTKAQP